MTKFHHYVLPAIPGLAIVVGCFLDDLCARGGWRRAAVVGADRASRCWRWSRSISSTRKSAAQRFLWLFSYDYVHNKSGRPWPDKLDFSGALIAFCVAFALATAALAMPRVRRWAAVGLSARRDRVHVLPAGRVHARRGAVVVAEGADRGLLPRTAARPTSG